MYAGNTVRQSQGGKHSATKLYGTSMGCYIQPYGTPQWRNVRGNRISVTPRLVMSHPWWIFAQKHGLWPQNNKGKTQFTVMALCFVARLRLLGQWVLFAELWDLYRCNRLSLSFHLICWMYRYNDVSDLLVAFYCARCVLIILLFAYSAVYYWNCWIWVEMVVWDV